MGYVRALTVGLDAEQRRGGALHQQRGGVVKGGEHWVELVPPPANHALLAQRQHRGAHRGAALRQPARLHRRRQRGGAVGDRKDGWEAAEVVGKAAPQTGQGRMRGGTRAGPRRRR
jgi:hypothetical protein